MPSTSNPKTTDSTPAGHNTLLAFCQGAQGTHVCLSPQSMQVACLHACALQLLCLGADRQQHTACLGAPGNNPAQVGAQVTRHELNAACSASRRPGTQPGCPCNAGLLPALSSVADAEARPWPVPTRLLTVEGAQTAKPGHASQADTPCNLSTLRRVLHEPPSPGIHCKVHMPTCPCMKQTRKHNRDMPPVQRRNRQADCGMHQHQQRLSQKAGAHAACQRIVLSCTQLRAPEVGRVACVLSRSKATARDWCCNHAHTRDCRRRLPMTEPGRESLSCQLLLGRPAVNARRCVYKAQQAPDTCDDSLTTARPCEPEGLHNTQGRLIHSGRCMRLSLVALHPPRMARQVSECSTKTPPSHAPLSQPYWYMLAC